VHIKPFGVVDTIRYFHGPKTACRCRPAAQVGGPRKLRQRGPQCVLQDLFLYPMGSQPWFAAMGGVRRCLRRFSR